ncbi:MAG: hypothetical protein JWR80_1527 [Bradyrhizobium sp.]|nr:hypothetical protein [Bradyrhizobium sp.]
MELRRLDLNLLVILDALFEEPTITRVAQRLQLSQPTVSAALAKLREVLGDELFVRSHGTMNPTPLAMELREPVRNVLSSIRHNILAKSAFEPGTSRDTFTIGLSDIGEIEFLPGLVQRFKDIAPFCRVKAVSRSPEALAQAIEAGDIDLAIGYFPDLTTSVFKQQVLFSHSTTVLVRADHPEFAAGITAEQYLKAKHIVVEQQTRHHDVVETALAQNDVVRDVVLTVSHYVNVPALVTQSDLVGTIATPLARRAAGHYPLALHKVPFDIPLREIKQLWHRRFDNSERLIWLRSQVASLSQNRPHL